MKRLCVLFVFASFALQMFGQSMVEKYKTGTITLEQDKSFASGVDWTKIFSDYEKHSYGKPVGLYKSVAVAPDGSVFVGNQGSYSISKFDANGKYIKTFGQKGKSSKDFKAQPTLGGVVGGKYVFTHEHNGHIKLFTLNGEFVKNIVVDYMPLKTIALTSNRIALIGHVPMGETNTRTVITIIDPETGEQNVIKKYDNIRENTQLVISKKKALYSYAPSMTSNRLFIRALPDGNLLVGMALSNKLTVYSPKGDLVKDIVLDYNALPYPQEMKKEFLAQMEKMVKTREGISSEDIAPIYKDDFFPKSMPYFYNVMVDAEGNVLVFRYVDKDVDHMFRVFTYSSDGKWIGDPTLNLSNYKLGLNSRLDEVAFHGNYLYGILQPNTNVVAAPQLVRFSIK